MSVLPILHWPDPVLSRPCAPVGTVDEAIRQFARDLLDTMYAAPGRGLAAPQVGRALRVFVMDVTWKDGAPDPVVLFDPVIDWASDVEVAGPEACLSIPGVTATVKRPASVRMRWTTLDGSAAAATFTGFAAVCAQHELDHLDGRVILDRLAPESRAAALAGYAA